VHNYLAYVHLDFKNVSRKYNPTPAGKVKKIRKKEENTRKNETK